MTYGLTGQGLMRWTRSRPAVQRGKSWLFGGLLVALTGKLAMAKALA